MSRVTTLINIPSTSIGQRRFLTVHQYGSLDPSVERAYIQASLHADEIPGLLVNHHLIKLLDDASSKGLIQKAITIIPYANPVGLSQQILGNHLGRFNVDTGVNFNRDWPNIFEEVALRVEHLLKPQDPVFNTSLIRNAIESIVNEFPGQKEENHLKYILYKLAATADIVLDLHCDSDAVMHMYTHDRLWPQMNDLAAEINSECQLIAGDSGGNPFDEACSCLWASLADRFPDCAIPMACQAVTIELRGEIEVYDHLAERDAAGIFRFLQRRGYIHSETELPPLPPLIRDAYPFTGVEMIEAPVPGVVAWKVRIGAWVEVDTILGEIINIEDPDAARVPLVSRVRGLVFGVRLHKLVRPGQIIIKVAGPSTLSWRKGNLLTAK